jgi:hypothetical protein
MGISILWDWFFLAQRRKKRAERLQKAQVWPGVQAKLLAGKLVDRDDLAEATLAQDRQVEFPFYFTLESGYFGGNVRTLPCSEGEARRLLKQVIEGTEITARYNPADPDEVCVLTADNAGALVVGVWEG